MVHPSVCWVVTRLTSQLVTVVRDELGHLYPFVRKIGISIVLLNLAFHEILVG